MAQSLYRQASLVMNPYGAKDTLLPSIKPTDGSGDFTFSRDGAGASPATRVNASGLIEKGRENLLFQSNTFSTTWTNLRSGETSGQSGYDGTNDAWLLESTATAASSFIQQSITNSGVYTMSVYAKAGTSNWLALATASSHFAYFDLQNGVIGSASGSNIIDYKIEQVGTTDWYRCIMTSSNNNDFYIFIANTDGVSTTNSGDNIYIQDAQLESGLVATSYIETTTAPVSAGLLGDMPRLDYHNPDSPTPNSCPSLLLEPSRVNIVDDSEYVTGYFNQNGAVVSYNEIISPEGVQNAFKLTSTTNGQARIEKSRPVGGTDTYTLSVFLKAGNSNFASLANFNRNASVRFNLSDGTIQGSGNVVDADIIPMGNEWYRCYMVMQEQASQTANIYKILVSSDGETYFANNGDYIYGYGAQLEAGSYPTSYIPTYGSASTRGADVPTNLSASNLIGSDEGVMFLDLQTPSAIEVDMNFSISDGTGSNYARIEVRQDLSIDIRYRIGGSNQISGTFGSFTAGDRLKLAFAYKSGDSALYMNGTQLTTSSATLSSNSFDEIRYSFATGIVGIEGDVNQTLLFKTRLTNAELAALTTI